MQASEAWFTKHGPALFGGAHVCELGCGTGRLLCRAQAAGAACIVGLDWSPAMLARARERLGSQAYVFV